METNVPMIAQQIFGAQPKPPKTIQLNLEGAKNDDESPNQTIFQVLLLLFLEGIKVLFDSTKPQNLSNEQIDLLRKYVHSYGIKLLIETQNMETLPAPTQIQKNNLKDYQRRFYDFERGLWHQVSFDWLI